jgi:hypothetical protein
MREIRDDAGVEWMVYEVQRREGLPSGGPDLPEPLRNGWLCFESATEKRRLTPVPIGWHALPDQDLSTLLADAMLVRRQAQRST